MSTRNETFVLWNVADANPTLGPLFNATYGKRLAPIIAMVAIRAGRLEIVSASLIGPATW